MKPIDADVLYTLISKYESEVTEEKINTKEDEGTFLLNCIRLNELKALKHLVDIVPILDVEPVRHGKWEKIEEYYDLSTIRCSLCHEDWSFEVYDDIESLNYRYCPNCGAKMDLK